MLPEIRYTILILFLVGIDQPHCYSQQISTDTAFVAASQKKSIALYTSAIQNQSRLYNGSDYIIYLPKFEEHPYFIADDWVYGSIVYWDELYENVPLLYDVSLDQVITEHNRGNPIKLIAEKIQSFTVLEHTFVRLNSDDKNKIAVGFYDRLYDGDLKVYAKYSKNFRETLESQQVIPQYDETTRYYLVKDGIFNIVKTKGSVLQVLSDQKQELKNFIRKNRLRFKDNREKSIVSVSEFYDTLKK